MNTILHRHLPEDMRASRPLPGIQPVAGCWLRVDEVYAQQMARREELLATKTAQVLSCPDAAMPAAQELLDQVLDLLPGLGFCGSNPTRCPDGRVVEICREDPLRTLGCLVQCDFCLLEKVGTEHVLKAAVLCFPASWQLEEKVGRPLTAIHDPVPEYDSKVSARVQRLFDGVQPGRPLWRFNRLAYRDAELFQPRSVHDPRRTPEKETPFVRLERQTIFRLPNCRWVVFAIHSYVLAAQAPTFS